MSPSEFVIRMTAADERFACALRRDDIAEMRAALAKKTELLESYFTVSRDRRRGEKDRAPLAAPATCDVSPASCARSLAAALRGGPGRRADVR